MSYSLQETVVEYTNEKMEPFHKKFSFVKEDLKQMAYCNFIDIVEAKALWGILYLRGLMKQDLFDSKTIWYHELLKDISGATMSLYRFSFISRLIEFDVKKKRNEHEKFDEFACFRNIVFEKIKTK